MKRQLIYSTLAGSKAYGTNIATSDEDIRNVYIETPREILGIDKFEQQVYSDNEDRVDFGLRKFVTLLKECNPSIIELLGTREQEVLYIDKYGKLLKDNYKIFLSKRAFFTFAGYATQQLRRLQNALAHDYYDEEDKMLHIKKSLDNLIRKNMRSYGNENSEITFELEDEIYINVNAKHLPLKKFGILNSDITNMLRNYAKLNHRNRKKDDNHLNKHAMHLVRLYLTGYDILTEQKIITYRENDLDLLMKIRNGEMDFKDVFKLADELEVKLQTAYEKSSLPDYANEEVINQFLYDVYMGVIKK